MERIFNIEMSEISMEQSKPSIWPDCLNLRKPICQGLAKVLESKSFHAKGNQVYHHYFPSLTIVGMFYINILFPFRSPQNSSAVRRSKSRGWRKIVAPKLLSHQQLPVNHHHHYPIITTIITTSTIRMGDIATVDFVTLFNNNINTLFLCYYPPSRPHLAVCNWLKVSSKPICRRTPNSKISALSLMMRRRIKMAYDIWYTL